MLAGGLVLLLLELATLIRRAPSGRLLVVSRPAVALAGLHAGAAFALGAVVVRDGGPEPLGIPYERLLLVHLSLALIGWLTVLIAAVGRTLVPMLGLAPAAPKAGSRRRARARGGALAVPRGRRVGGRRPRRGRRPRDARRPPPPARLFGRVATSGKIGVREGPVAHVAVGLVFLLQAALLALAAVAGIVSDRRAAVAGVLFLGFGWAVGVIVGHAGKLVSLSGWGSWPPGQRPKQADLYPRGGWQVESVLFAAGVELLAGGVALDSETVARLGAGALVVAALVAFGSAVEHCAPGRRRAAVAKVGRQLARQSSQASRSTTSCAATS